MVGANQADNLLGAAYVFTRSGNTWTQQQKLTPSDSAAVDNFGYSVAISGDTIVVGKLYGDVGANSTQGSAYVFTRSGTVWSEQQRLTASDGAAGDFFGNSVAISGDTIVVAAVYDAVDGNIRQGSAYVFTRSGTVWTQQQKLTANDGAADDRFGGSVSISGDTVVIGSDYDDTGANTNQGSAYVFTRSGSIWTQQQKLTASDAAFADYFGSVAINGDTIVVGARWADVGANGSQGSAYIFTRSGTVWSEQAKLTASDGAAGDTFGYSTAISGNVVAVGAYNAAVGSNLFQGVAYVFTRSGSIWTQQQKLTASDAAYHDQFGYSAAVNGNTVVVGVPFDAVGVNLQQGSAWVFDLVP